MRISDWSSDVCSSDLVEVELAAIVVVDLPLGIPQQGRDIVQRRRSVASLHEGTGRRFQYSRPALFLAAESRLGFPQELESRLAFVGRGGRHFFSTERGLN